MIKIAKKGNKQDIKISESLDSQILALNKKFPKLAKVSDKYKLISKDELNFEQIKDAFINKSDPHILMQRYKDFVNEYLKNLKYISKNYTGLVELPKTEDELIKFDDTLIQINNTIDELDKLFLNTEKQEILNEIVNAHKENISKEEYERRIATAEKK